MISSNVDISTLMQKDYSKVDVSNMQTDKLKDVCDSFEAFFMQQLLDISLKNSKIAGSGTGNEIIKGMYTESLSQQSAGTLGISDMLYKFLSEKNNNQKGKI